MKLVRDVRGWTELWIPFAFLTVAVLLFWPVVPAINERFVGETDATTFGWYMAWTPYALRHGALPFLTDHQFAPYGLNLVQQAGMPLVGLVTWVPQRLFGVITAYNLAMITGLAASGYAAYVATRRLVRSRLPAFVAGLVYAFNSYTFAHVYGHLNLTILVFPPLCLIVLDEVLRKKSWSPRRSGVILGVAASAQLLVGAEVLVLSIVVAAAVVGGFVVQLYMRDRVSAAQHTAHLRRSLAIAALVAAPLSAVPIGVFLLGPDRPPELRRSAFSTDLANVVLPTRIQQFSPPVLETRLDRLATSWPEQNAYIGLPLLALLGVAWRAARRDRVAKLAATLIAVGFVLSLGARPRVLGEALPIPLPGLPLAFTPVLRGVIPARYMSFAWLGIGLLLAVWLALPGRRWFWWLALAVALIPQIPARLQTDAFATPRYFKSDAKELHSQTLLVLPASPIPRAYAHAWQVEAGFSFKMVNGYGRPGAIAVPRGSRDPFEFFVDLERGESAPDDLAPVRRGLCHRRVDAIVAGPQVTRSILDVTERLVGKPPTNTQGVTLWTRVREGMC